MNYEEVPVSNETIGVYVPFDEPRRETGFLESYSGCGWYLVVMAFCVVALVGILIYANGRSRQAEEVRQVQVEEQLDGKRAELRRHILVLQSCNTEAEVAIERALHAARMADIDLGYTPTPPSAPDVQLVPIPIY